MRPFTKLDAIACPLAMSNVDTDQLIPARFMRRPRGEGYGNFLLYDQRFDGEGRKKPGVILNDETFAGAEILVAARNFGSGSSREAAVYALADFGFRVVIAPSFGDIFASNAVKNGVLPALVSEADADALLKSALIGQGQPIAVDLASQTIQVGNQSFPFEIDPVWKKQLLNGWDDIDMTLDEGEAIAAFCERDKAARPWSPPRRPAS